MAESVKGFKTKSGTAKYDFGSLENMPDFTELPFPSKTGVDLGVSTASGTQMTAPADGYVVAQQKVSSNSATFLELINHTRAIGLTTVFTSATGFQPLIFIPVVKGDIFAYYYNSTNKMMKYKFVYAIGTESGAV